MLFRSAGHANTAFVHATTSEEVFDGRGHFELAHLDGDVCLDIAACVAFEDFVLVCADHLVGNRGRLLAQWLDAFAFAIHQPFTGRPFGLHGLRFAVWFWHLPCPIICGLAGQIPTLASLVAHGCLDVVVGVDVLPGLVAFAFERSVAFCRVFTRMGVVASQRLSPSAATLLAQPFVCVGVGGLPHGHGCLRFV